MKSAWCTTELHLKTVMREIRGVSCRHNSRVCCSFPQTKSPYTSYTTMRGLTCEPNSLKVPTQWSSWSASLPTPHSWTARRWHIRHSRLQLNAPWGYRSGNNVSETDRLPGKQEWTCSSGGAISFNKQPFRALMPSPKWSACSGITIPIHMPRCLACEQIDDWGRNNINNNKKPG